MNPLPSKCPVCGGPLVVTRLHCHNCETSIEGAFAPGGTALQEAFSSDQLRSLLPFSKLTQEQLYFVLTFVRCEGRFNRMEEELNLSYPTLRSRLDEIILALGFKPSPSGPGREDAAAAAAPSPVSNLPGLAERQSILDMLNRAEISVEEARRRLRGEPPQETPTPSQTPEPEGE